MSDRSHHCYYLCREDLFCTVLLCSLATSSYLLLLLVHTISVLYRAHLCMKCSLGISNFLEEIPSVFQSVVFLNFFSWITEEGFLTSVLWNSAFKWVHLSFSPLLFTSFLFIAIL